MSLPVWRSLLTVFCIAVVSSMAFCQESAEKMKGAALSAEGRKHLGEGHWTLPLTTGYQPGGRRNLFLSFSPLDNEAAGFLEKLFAASQTIDKRPVEGNAMVMASRFTPTLRGDFNELKDLGALGYFRCDVDGTNLRVKVLVTTDMEKKVKDGSRIDFVIPLEQIENKRLQIDVTFESKDIDRIGTWQKGAKETLRKNLER